VVNSSQGGGTKTTCDGGWIYAEPRCLQSVLEWPVNLERAESQARLLMSSLTHGP